MKSVLVLGNARSGTSMTAGMLNILGVDFHESSKSQKHIEQNPKGTFENINFITITSNMHRDYKSGKTLKWIKDNYEIELKNMIRSHEKPLWGFKSALTHHFTGLIIPLLKNPHIVIVLRSLLHNAQSWMVHMKEVYGQNVALEHALEVMSKSQDSLIRNSLAAKCPKLYTSYEHIKQDPWREAKRMAEFLAIDAEPKKQEILDFVMPNYTTLDQIQPSAGYIQ